jgi:hypothetical protein
MAKRATSNVLAACTDDAAWWHDPAIMAARDACQSPSGIDYNCVEQAAVAASNPEICRLVGIGIDDMCLQAVYEAANTPSICGRIYLQGVVPNCRAYYAQRSSGSLSLTMTPQPASSPSPTVAPTSSPSSAPIATPTPQYVLDLSGYDPDIFPPIAISHNPPLIARLPATNAEGESLRYYVEFGVPEAGYGPDMVRQAYYEGHPQRVGPPAMDVADDGRIALM